MFIYITYIYIYIYKILLSVISLWNRNEAPVQWSWIGAYTRVNNGGEITTPPHWEGELQQGLLPGLK